jgi:hypothetical protein
MDMNPELLKQLLAEFEEKQAVTTEEINEIEKQIEELRARIELSRDRLKEVEQDREKVGAMKARYAEGDWTGVLQDLSKLRTEAPAPERSAPEPALAAKVDKTPKRSKNSAPEASDNGSGKNVEPEAPPAPPVPPHMPPPPPPKEPDAPPPAPPAPPAPPLAPTMEMDMPQTLPTPSAPPAPPSEGLFPFSQASQEQTGDMPWGPTPAMSWDSVNAQSFPSSESTDPQLTGYTLTPDGNNPFLESGSKLGIPNPQPFQGGQSMPAPPQGFAPPPGFGGAPDASATPAQAPPPFPPGAPFPMPGGPPPGNPAPPAGFGAPAGAAGNPDILSTAFDEEFDIAAALRGENEPGGEKEEGDVKKINDALRGLFS